MSWFLLIIAGLLEIVWAVAMKQSEGFTRPIPTLIMAAAVAGSFFLLAAAMRSLPLGTAYMVWTGIGALGAFVVGITFMGEGLTVLRALAALMILCGILIMKAAG